MAEMSDAVALASRVLYVGVYIASQPPATSITPPPAAENKLATY